MKSDVLVCANAKGGVGKTTLALGLAWYAVKQGEKVLLVDLDGQANSTFSVKGDKNLYGAFQMFKQHSLDGCIQTTPHGIDLVAGSRDLNTVKSTVAGATVLFEALKPVRRKYSRIIIDTPPNAGVLMFNGLYAAQRLVIPMEPDSMAVPSMLNIVGIAQQIATTTGLKIAGAVFTRWDSRPRLHRYIQSLVQQHCEELGIPLLPAIRQGVSVPETVLHLENLFDYAPKSNPALDTADVYKALYPAQ